MGKYQLSKVILKKLFKKIANNEQKILMLVSKEIKPSLNHLWTAKSQREKKTHQLFQTINMGKVVSIREFNGKPYCFVRNCS